jgi:DNA primase
MFAIQDLHGNVVGFTGRTLSADAKEAKYVNTPETAVYHKSSILYGLDKAKGEIKRQNLAVIVEGNMDVVSSHRVGVTNVVCTSGTALTTEQLLLLERFTKNLAIAFDADTAGIAATLRGLDLARARDFNVKIISLPPEAGKDPDDAINQDSKMWTQAIHEAADVMDWVFRAAFKGRNIGKPEDKKIITEELLPEIRRITNPVVRDHWITKLASGLSVAPEALREALGQGAGVRAQGAGVSSRASAATSRTPVKASQHELTYEERMRDLGERILSVFILKPEFLGETDERLAEDLPQDLSTLYKTWEHAYLLSRSSGQVFSREESSDETKKLVDYLTIRADRDFSEQTLPALKREYEQARAQLRAMHGSAARQRLEEEMRNAELSGDVQRIEELTKQFQQLTT